MDASDTPRQEAPLNADIQPIFTLTKRSRTLIAQWIALRAVEPDITNAEVASRLGVNKSTLTGCIQRAVRSGILEFEDPLARMSYQIVPKVIDGLNALLDQGDKTAIIEAAKGTVFKTYAESMGVREAPQTVLALKIEQAPANSDIKIIAGHIVGRPKGIAREDEDESPAQS